MIKRAMFAKGSDRCKELFHSARYNFLFFLGFMMVIIWFNITVGLIMGIGAIIFLQITLYYAKRYIEEVRREEDGS